MSYLHDNKVYHSDSIGRKTYFLGDYPGAMCGTRNFTWLYIYVIDDNLDRGIDDNDIDDNDIDDNDVDMVDIDMGHIDINVELYA